MNFYQRHIGDYIRDTAHLSLLEHGVYSRLLDVYYSRESPIEADQAYRLIGARSDEERAAADVVLGEFFERDGVTWRHKRCDSEIQTYLETEPEREDRKANQRERQRRSRERRRELFRLLREKGDIPPFDTATRDLVTRLSRVTNTAGVTPVTCDDTGTQYPIPNTQYPVLGEEHPVDTSPLPLALQVETGVSTEAKVKTMGQFIPQDFELTAERRQVAVAERVPNVDREFQRFKDYWLAASGANARKRDWEGTWRNWCRKAADMGGRQVAGPRRETIDERLEKLRNPI